MLIVVHEIVDFVVDQIFKCSKCGKENTKKNEGLQLMLTTKSELKRFGQEAKSESALLFVGVNFK